MKTNNLLHDIKHLSYTELREKYQYMKSSEQVLIDINNKTSTALKHTYPKEYKAWDNIKGRAKGNYSEEFEYFIGFLFFVGKVGNKNLSIDRIDPHDPEYAPGKVRWADKKTQSNNQIEHISPFPAATREKWEHNYKLHAKRNSEDKIIEPREYYFLRACKEGLNSALAKSKQEYYCHMTQPEHLYDDDGFQLSEEVESLINEWESLKAMAERAVKRYKQSDQYKLDTKTAFSLDELLP